MDCIRPPRVLTTLLTVTFLVIFCESLLGQKKQIDSLNNLFSTGNDSSKMIALNELSWIYKNSNVDSAIMFARRALYLAKQKRNQKFISKAFNSLGSAKQASGEYDSALYYLNQSIETSSKDDSLSMPNVLNNIGIIYDEKGDYDKALQSYFKGLQMAQKTGAVTIQAYILSNIGIVYKKQKQYDKVLEYYTTALELYKKLNSSFGITVTSGNIGSVLLQTKEYQKSIDYSLIAKKGYEELGYTRYVPYTLGNMAIAYDSLHQPDKAEGYYRQAYNEHLKFDNQYEAAYNSKNLVFFYLKNHKVSEAKLFADKAIASAEKIGAKEMVRDSYNAMSRIAKELGDYKEAYRYQQKYMSLKDSLFEESKTKTIFELEVKYESEAKELELSQQKVLLATNALELEQRNIQVLSLASATLFLLILGVLIYQNQLARRKKLKQESEFQLKLAEAKLENELHQDRLRISRDLHDNIGSRLLFLYTATENLAERSAPESSEKAEQLSLFAKNTLHELRRTVWFINKDNVNLEELQLKLKEYFNFLNQSATLTIDMVLNADPSNIIPSPKAAAIFRVAQEAVSNAIKHSGAHHININLTSSSDNDLQLTISDDGNGFDQNTSGDGNGLKNMQLHASNAKGTISIKSEKKQGTSIVLTLPLD
ncbi:MAG: tetratricopeptide repeat protein [Cyclobacteriaceae bacterium]|nr:tetratricopeptide repeat protein [Cyclobacteriaceae bacterium]